jgi:hypothetical protein
MSSRRRPSRTADDARSITQSLQRSQKLLQHELERVSHVSQAIQDDGVLLGATRSHHVELSDEVKKSNKALMQLKLQQQKERLVFMSAVAFYVLVVLYVLWTRIPLFGVDYLISFLWRGIRVGMSRLYDLQEYATEFLETKL